MVDFNDGHRAARYSFEAHNIRKKDVKWKKCLNTFFAMLGVAVAAFLFISLLIIGGSM